MSADPRADFDEIVAELTAVTPATPGKMFSMPCLKINGKVFAGLYRGEMVFKLPVPQHTTALNLAGSHLFDPSGANRPMKEWVVVPVQHTSTWLGFALEALRYVQEGSKSTKKRTQSRTR